MRTLDELGISPAPWRTYGDGEVYMAGGVNPVCVVGNLCDERREASLARFIAAAPMLYDALQFIHDHISLTAIGGGADVVFTAKVKMHAALKSAACTDD